MKDPSKNFGDAAKRYSAFRPEYPTEIFQFLIDHAHGRHDFAVDLGAGTGQATRQLAELFNRVVAVEPDSRLADDGNFSSNVTIDIKTSEEACFQPGSVDAIISATAFHWMDQQMVCRNVSRWLRPGGVFFPFAYHEFSVEGTAKVIFDQEFDKWRPFRDRRLVDNYDYEDALKTSRAFGAVIPFVSSVQYDLSAEFAFGLISTFSYARAYAGAQGDADSYFRSLKKAFTECGKRHTLIVPIVGALGVKN